MRKLLGTSGCAGGMLFVIFLHEIQRSSSAVTSCGGFNPQMQCMLQRRYRHKNDNTVLFLRKKYCIQRWKPIIFQVKIISPKGQRIRLRRILSQRKFVRNRLFRTSLWHNYDIYQPFPRVLSAFCLLFVVPTSKACGVQHRTPRTGRDQTIYETPKKGFFREEEFRRRGKWWMAVVESSKTSLGLN